MNNGMPSKLIKHFIDSAAGLLAAFTTALFLANIANSRVTQPHDPLFAIPMDSFFWFLALAATAVIFVCVLMRNLSLKLAGIFGFASTLIIYRLGLLSIGAHNANGYADPLAFTFNLSNVSTNCILNVLFLYLFLLSATLLNWTILSASEVVPCKSVSTNGKVYDSLPPLNAHQNISCPACAGRIEFPEYAVGQTIPCPHCKMEIILKEPA